MRGLLACVAAALLLAAGALAVVWVASRWFWPYKPCPRCTGSGRNPGSNTKRHGDCRRCKGARRVRRLGAGHVHRLRLSIRNNRNKETKSSAAKGSTAPGAATAAGAWPPSSWASSSWPR